MGSLLAIALFGIFLSFYYSNGSVVSFNSVQFIMYGVGVIFIFITFNGASPFCFIFTLFNALFYSSYCLINVWFIGFIIIAESFLGHSLPEPQISFWATVVTTSLFSVLPFYGFKFVFWEWSGFFVSGLTLNFFLHYTFYYLDLCSF